jgi:RNA polymerase sigma-70 factor (ECF subfamily)
MGSLGEKESSAVEARRNVAPRGFGTLEKRPADELVARAVRRARVGDRDALAFLYARFADDVCGYACSIVHNQHDAEDVTQQVFAKLMRVIGKYEERDVPFFAWMLRVTRNVAVDHLRRTRKQREVPVEDIHESNGGIRRIAPASRTDELADALATLPEAQREVLVLRHIAGLSPTEIAERTGRTDASVHGLHHRGRRALIEELTSRGAAPVTARALRSSGQRLEPPPA